LCVDLATTWNEHVLIAKHRFALMSPKNNLYKPSADKSISEN
jgi:hypothetical protein